MKSSEKLGEKKIMRIRAAVVVMAISVIALLATTVIVYTRNNSPAASKDAQMALLKDVKREYAQIDTYAVYGNHLLLGGTVDASSYPDFDRVGMILRRADGTEVETVLKSTVKNGVIRFKTYEKINTGFCLDEMKSGDYCVLFHVVLKDGSSSCISSENCTSYGNIEYYTVTKNGANRRIVMGFEHYSNSVERLSCFAIKVRDASLPENVYDVCIDPGHGGNDPGAVAFGYHEDDINLENALALKAALEKEGLKVCLTRDGTEDSDSMLLFAAYDSDGRVERAVKSHAKYNFSLHLNAGGEGVKVKEGGVQVYCPNGADISFGQAIADNIVNYTGTGYSMSGTGLVGTGVYIRTFSEKEIKESEENAAEMKFTPYETLSTDTTYYYMIRELGGITTGAYVDGRNPDYEKNEAYNSNIGIESYLLELGFICVEDDLGRILGNRDAYIDAIASAICDELKIGKKVS